MSYILDALRRSEKERQRGTRPDFLTVQDAIEEESKERSLIPYLLIISLLINAAVMVWWFDPWQSKKSGQTPSYSTEKRQPESKQALAPSQHATSASGLRTKIERDTSPSDRGIVTSKNEGRPKSANRQQLPMNASTYLEHRASNPRAEIGVKSLHDITPLIQQQTRPIQQVPSGQKSIIKNVASGENALYGIEDLPLSVQRSLPPITISVSLYSDEPGSRMAKINGAMIREGEYLTAGLRVEEIMPDGVIFSYQNYRFLARPK
jgi:general secretion pathway protein B